MTRTINQRWFTIVSLTLLAWHWQRARQKVCDLLRQHSSLRRSEEQLRALLSHTSDICVLVDASGGIRLLNPPAARLWPGGSAADAGTFWLDLVHPDEQAHAEQLFAEALARPRSQVAARLCIRHYDGGWRMMDVDLKNLLDDPALGGLLIICRPVTAVAEAAMANPDFPARERELQQAIERDELEVFYQPIVSLATGDVLEVEALARWRHPRRGIVPPAEFIPLAEATGLIVPLGLWVVREACRQALQWQREHVDRPRVVVCVNLSAGQLRHPQLADHLAEILRDTGLEPARLKLEITESAMVHDREMTLMTLRRLKVLGVDLALDDFGTGYSSLQYLHLLPIDVIKVDRGFVRQLGENDRATAIVEAIMTLAQGLSLTVVGEGMETPEQIQRMRALGCERAQGFFFAEPLPAEQMERFLRQPGLLPQAPRAA